MNDLGFKFQKKDCQIWLIKPDQTLINPCFGLFYSGKWMMPKSMEFTEIMANNCHELSEIKAALQKPGIPQGRQSSHRYKIHMKTKKQGLSTCTICSRVLPELSQFSGFHSQRWITAIIRMASGLHYMARQETSTIGTQVPPCTIINFLFKWL